jgi:hypothetical protein
VVGRGMKIEGSGNGEVARHIARSFAVDVVLRGERRGKYGVWGVCGRRGNETMSSLLGEGCMVGASGGQDVYINIIPRWSIWDARGSGAVDIDEWDSLS